MGLDLVVANVGYVVVDLLGLCCVCSLIANKKLMYYVVSGEFSNGYSGLKNGVDFWDSKTSPEHVTLDVTLTTENSGIQNGGKINLEVEDKCKNEDTYVVNPPLSQNSLQKQNAEDISLEIDTYIAELLKLFAC